MERQRVLFLCTGNSARSQMAEAFLRKYAGDRFDVYSAGLEPKGVNPLTVIVMQEAGIDISSHTSKSLDTFLGKMAVNVLITVCDDADQNCPTYWPVVGQRLHWSFPDPAAAQGMQNERLAVFRRVRDQIDQKIRDWLAEQSRSMES